MQTQNLLVNTGDINTGNYQLRLRAEGTYKDIQDIRDQLIVTKSGGEVRLGDIATVERGYMDPPSNLMRVDGKRAMVSVSLPVRKTMWLPWVTPWRII